MAAHDETKELVRMLGRCLLVCGKHAYKCCLSATCEDRQYARGAVLRLAYFHLGAAYFLVVTQ